jgi:hypothetical protein
MYLLVTFQLNKTFLLFCVVLAMRMLKMARKLVFFFRRPRDRVCTVRVVPLLKQPPPTQTHTHIHTYIRDEQLPNIVYSFHFHVISRRECRKVEMFSEQMNYLPIWQTDMKCLTGWDSWRISHI